MSEYDDRRRLRALALAATPGPWFDHDAHGAWVSTATREGGYGDWIADADVPRREGEPGVSDERYRQSGDNARYIAAASPNVVLDLLDEIDRLILEVS